MKTASRNRDCSYSKQGGFTLVELMVTIAVAAILLALAVPSFYEMSLNSKLKSAANDLAASALLARSEAIKRNATVQLCVSTNGTACTTGSWEAGWIVVSGTEVLQYRQAAPSGFKVLANRASITFQPSGIGATPGDFSAKVCRATPSVGARERIVDISPTGRPSVTQSATGVCSA
jgi:type IV fimbrial biogenesis protein FimT